MLTAYDVQGYAGSFGIGVMQAGFTIVAKTERADKFGLKAWQLNQERLTSYDVDHSGAPRAVGLVYGNPPCSGFSNLTLGVTGYNAPQNACMRDLVEFGAACKATVICFESVQPAGRSPLMDHLVRPGYTLTRVFMNSIGAGGWQNRPRFFFVASRLGPLMTLPCDLPARPLSAALDDLRKRLEPGTKYDTMHTPRARQQQQLAEFGNWAQGMNSWEVYDKAVANGYTGEMRRSDSIKCPFNTRRWFWDKPSRVVTGGFLSETVHSVENRPHTHAEAARLMGYPDDWDLREHYTKVSGKELYGKAIPAQSGRWIAASIALHLEGKTTSNMIEPQHGIVDVTNDWKRYGAHPEGVYDLRESGVSE